MIEDAGFDEVSTQADTKTLRLPAPEEFLWGYVYSTPLAGVVAAVDDERLRSLERDVVDGWQEFVRTEYSIRPAKGPIVRELKTPKKDERR